MIAVLLVGLLVFVMGGMLLMLFLGAQGIEERLMEDDRREKQLLRQIAPVPQFLVVTQPSAPRLDGLDEAFLLQLCAYLEAEETLASEFVMQPSLENLYRESGRRLTEH